MPLSIFFAGNWGAGGGGAILIIPMYFWMNTFFITFKVQRSIGFPFVSSCVLGKFG